MIKNYFKIAWRNLFKNSFASTLSILGLSVGLTSFIIILLFINRETSYDKWSPQLNDTYRVLVSQTDQDGENISPSTPYPLGLEIKNSFPEVEQVTRVFSRPSTIIKIGDNSFTEPLTIFADSNFFDLFAYKFIYGSASAALMSPGKVVLGKKLAEKYFGSDNPVGKQLETVKSGGNKTYEVSGVIDDSNLSHLNFKCCFSYFNNEPNYWGRQFYITYVKVNKHSSLSLLEKKTSDIYLKGYANYLSSEGIASKEDIKSSSFSKWLSKEQGIKNLHVLLEKVPNIHLEPKAVRFEGNPEDLPVDDYAIDNKKPLFIFSLIAGLILLMACINFINFSIARSTKRAKEIGIRKVSGSTKSSLVAQFLTESFLQCLIAMGLAILVLSPLLELINTHLELDLSLWSNHIIGGKTAIVIQLVLILIVTTLLAGIYPAFILASQSPTKIFRGNIIKGNEGNLFRRSLIVVQFIIAIAFISSLSVIYSQINYMQKNDPGFNNEQVLVLKPNDIDLITPDRPENRIDFIKNNLKNIPGIEQVVITDGYPGTPSFRQQDARALGQDFKLNFQYIDFNYFHLLGMKVISGRDFSESFSTDTLSSAIINESAVKTLGLKQPIGEKINILLRDYNVVGVLKDNLKDGYNQSVNPTIYTVGAERGLLTKNYILMKVSKGNPSIILASVNKFWKTLEPDFPLNYSWADEDFTHLMKKYVKLNSILIILSVIALFIALMGVLALTAFSVEQKTKEIGIRKVFGIGIKGIIQLLSKEFISLITIAISIALPIIWILMGRWMNNFAFHVELNWWMFLAIGLLTMIFALTITSFYGLKAAKNNPIKSLRTE